MKLVIEDVSSSEIELEDVEITILNKTRPNVSYKFSPIGGYILIRRTEHENYSISIESNIKVLTVETDISNEIFNYRG